LERRNSLSKTFSTITAAGSDQEDLSIQLAAADLLILS
jgi:hypothetical protein